MVNHEGRLFEMTPADEGIAAAREEGFPVRDEYPRTSFLTDLSEFLDCLEIAFGYQDGNVEKITKGRARDAWRICLRLSDRFEMYNLRTWLEENFPQ